MKEYVGLLTAQEDNSKYIGKEFAEVEKEDMMATNQFDNMQEMANAPFGPNMSMSKEEYAQQIAALEEAERKHNE